MLPLRDEEGRRRHGRYEGQNGSEIDDWQVTRAIPMPAVVVLNYNACNEAENERGDEGSD